MALCSKSIRMIRHYLHGMIEAQVQDAFDALVKVLQFLVVWLLRGLRCQQAELPPAKPEPLARQLARRSGKKKKEKKSAKRSRS